ncbi:MAG: hypothetical protein M3495_04140, partial [Pseudomonadota bacterium]|nr:hypothetical protein [Pseudomonadota bacterium]
APQPDGRPGYLRIDSVHQGDEDGVKGVYHINAVDCVTQWEIVPCWKRLAFDCPRELQYARSTLARRPTPASGFVPRRQDSETVAYGR